MALPWVPQWEENTEESRCDFQLSLPPQVQSSQFVQRRAHSLPAATQPQDTESWTLFTNEVLLKAKSQPGLFPLLVHCGCTSKSRSSSSAGIPTAQKKTFAPVPSPSCSLLGTETSHWADFKKLSEFSLCPCNALSPNCHRCLLRAPGLRPSEAWDTRYLRGRKGACNMQSCRDAKIC